MIQFIKSIYIATTMTAIISYILNFRRLKKYYKKIDLIPVFDLDSLICLIICFIPILNILYGAVYFNISMFNDEEMEKYLNENNLEE